MKKIGNGMIDKIQKNNIVEIQSCVEGEKYDAIYVRESTKSQAQNGYNIFNQEEICINYRKVFGKFKGAKIYREKGYSAKTTARPIFDILLEDIKDGKIGRVIVQKLDRLARRGSGMYPLLEMFQDYDVILVSIREQIDTSNATWKMTLGLFTLLNEIEQDQIGERVTEALLYACEQGSYIKGGKMPLGLCKDYVNYVDGTKAHMWKLHRNIEEWKLVELIYKMADEGSNCYQISLAVSNHEIAKKLGITLSDDGVERILSKKIYMGLMNFKGKDYAVSFEGAFSSEYWNRVQKNRRVHFKRDTKNFYYYHKKVYCSCGTHCIVDCTNKQNATGLKKYFYYYCPTCRKRISQEKIKESVDPRVQKKYTIDLKEKCNNVLNERIGRAKALKHDIYNMYISNSIDSDTYIEQIKMITYDIEQTEKRLKYEDKKYDDLKEKEREQFFDMSVDRIIVNMQKKNVRLEYC